MTDTSLLCPDPEDGRIISWAQNAEDIILKRIFAGQRSGFWVDVGANHPFRDSVTKNLYDSGWSGVNIEPVPHFFNLLVSLRPRDVNLCCVAGSENSLVSFEVNESNLDLSDVAGPGDADQDCHDQASLIEVQMLTLTEIFESSVPPGVTVDFLKIDVEGFEIDVLEGCDFETVRPRVVIVETSQNSRGRVIDLCQSGGLFHAHWDGVNDWFIDESLSLALDENTWRPTHPVLHGYHPWIYQVIVADLRRQVDFDRTTIAALSSAKGYDVSRIKVSLCCR